MLMEGYIPKNIFPLGNNQRCEVEILGIFIFSLAMLPELLLLPMIGTRNGEQDIVQTNLVAEFTEVDHAARRRYPPCIRRCSSTGRYSTFSCRRPLIQSYTGRSQNLCIIKGLRTCLHHVEKP